MALIRVNGAHSWKCSAEVFEGVLRQTQPGLATASPALAKTVEFVIGSQLHWWSIADLSSAEFQSFLRAAEAAEKACAAKGPAPPNDLDRYAGVLARWGELIQVLQADPRAQERAAGSGQ